MNFYEINGNRLYTQWTVQFVLISRLPLICTGLLLVFGIHHIHDEIDPSFHYGIDQVGAKYSKVCLERPL